MEEKSNYTRLRQELEDIVVQVRSKDVPLEKSLDLFDEALKIGGQCVEAIDRADFSFGESDDAGDEAVDADTVEAPGDASAVDTAVAADIDTD